MTYTDSDQHEAKETGAKAWDRIMGASLALPGAKVDRGSFLYSQLIKAHYGFRGVVLKG